MHDSSRATLAAPSTPQRSAADIAAFEAASYLSPAGRAALHRRLAASDDPTIPGPRGPVDNHPGDSDPNPDELLRRAQGLPLPSRTYIDPRFVEALSPAGQTALSYLELAMGLAA